MKNLFRSIITYVLVPVLYSSNVLLADDPPQYSYVGAEACAKCHNSEKIGNQFSIWQTSIHAHAYVALQTEEAAKVAKEMGYDKAPTELQECLTCHASGYDVDESLLGEGFHIENGVQCETCHGPGSAYKTLKIMKNRELAVQNGLVKVYENTEEFCRNCHNPDSPTYAGFNFEEMWEKIEHNVPVKNKEK